MPNDPAADGAPKTETLQPVDAAARAVAKDLVRCARSAALATLDPASGAPAASRVAVATDIDGAPVFLTSDLSPHAAALTVDPRCGLMFGQPGKGDPLAHPRLSVSGAADRLARGADRDRVRRRFLARHPKAELYVDFGDFAFWRLDVASASLNGGYGKAYAPTAADLSAPDAAGLAEAEAGAVDHMNKDHLDAVADYAAAAGLDLARGWRLADLDADGLSIVAGDEVRRIPFERPLTSADALRPALVAMAKRARMGRSADG